jgi:8-hydroxy-5-deazaflavin:NADPH oxidoreductase
MTHIPVFALDPRPRESSARHRLEHLGTITRLLGLDDLGYHSGWHTIRPGAKDENLFHGEILGENMTTIAVIGGTGKEGQGLARRWAHAGHSVIIGSREAARAAAAASELNGQLGKDAPAVRGLGNAAAAHAAEVVVLAVPYEAHRATLETIENGVQGKVLIDVTAPLDPAHKQTAYRVPEGSAGLAAQQFLGQNVRVVSAFQNISYTHLSNVEADPGGDVLVCGNDPTAKQIVIALAKDAGLTAFDAGPIENAVVAEGLTAVLININRAFKIKNAGIRLTGVPRE